MSPFIVGFGVFFVLIAGAILVTALFTLVRSIKGVRRAAELKRVGIRVSGAVVDNQMESRTSSSTTPGGAPGLPEQTTTSRYFVFRPVVRFHAQSGQEVTAVAANVSRRSFVSGTQVPLIYHPDRPGDVLIEGGPGAGSAVAVVFSAIISVVILVIIAGAIVAFLALRADNPGSDDCPPGFPAGLSCSTN